MDFQMAFPFADTAIVSFLHFFLIVAEEIDGDGRRRRGALPFWYVKDSDDTSAEGIERMLSVVKAACGHARASDPGGSHR